MQKRISSLVGIIIIVAVSIVLFGGVFAWQHFATKSQISINEPQASSNTQNAEWKTYNKFGIEFKYPQEWSNPQERIGGKMTEIDFESGLFIYFINNYNNITGKIDTFDQLVNNTVSDMKRIGPPPYNITEKDASPMVSINGIREKIVSYTNNASKPNIDVYLPMDENNTVMFENNNSSVPDETFNQILSTFKFTK